MNTKLVILIFLICSFFICFISCNKKEHYQNTSEITFGSFGSPVYLKAETVDLDAPLMKPRRVIQIDSFLFAQNVQTEFFVDRYNMNTLKKTGEYITFGGGPDELLWLHKIQQKDSSTWFFDSQKRTFTQYGVRDLCEKDTFTFQQKVRIEDPFSDVLALPDNRFVATILSSQHKRLTFYDAKGKMIETTGDFPSFGKEFTKIETLEGYVCEMVLSSDIKKIILFYKQTDLVEVYDVSGHLIKRIHGPEHFFPDVKEQSYGEKTKVSASPNESRDAYFCPAIVGEEIFVLYSGKLYNPDQPSYLLNQLFVFDKNGNPQKQFELSEPIFTFTVDPVKHVIYGLTDNPEFRILKYSY